MEILSDGYGYYHLYIRKTNTHVGLYFMSNLCKLSENEIFDFINEQFGAVYGVTSLCFPSPNAAFKCKEWLESFKIDQEFTKY